MIEFTCPLSNYRIRIDPAKVTSVTEGPSEHAAGEPLPGTSIGLGGDNVFVFESYDEVLGRLGVDAKQIVLGDPRWPSLGHAVQAYLADRQRFLPGDLLNVIATLMTVT